MIIYRLGSEGSNLVAVNGRKPLFTNGSAKWSSRFCRGLLPVTMACNMVTLSAQKQA